MKKITKRYRMKRIGAFFCIVVLVGISFPLIGHGTDDTVSPSSSESKEINQKENEFIPIDDDHFGETFKDYVSQLYDKDKDGYLSIEERNKAVYIQMDTLKGSDDKYTVDFKGLDYFPNVDDIVVGRSDGFGGTPIIKNLDLSERNMLIFSLHGALMTGETLDLSKSSRASYIKLNGSELANVILPPEALNLKYLNLDSLSNVDMNVLDISGYPNLEKLYARYGTDFEKLKADNQKKLKYLKLGSSKMTEIDLSPFPNLIELSISRSPIKEIDVSSNYNLTSLGITDTEISSLDLSQLKNLEGLAIQNNHLSILDLTNQSKLLKLALNPNSYYPFFDGVPNEAIDGIIQQDDQTSSWQVDFNQWIPSDQLSRISMREYMENDWSYDEKTGLATYLKTEKPEFIDYKYETNSVNADNWSKNTAMYVRATLAQGFTVHANSMAGGSTTPTGNTVYRETETPTYTITPDPGYGIDRVTVDGSEVSLTDTNTFTFDPLQANHQLEATFRLLPIVTASATTGGQVNPTGETAYPFGSEATYTVKPDEGYQIKQVLMDGKEITLTEDTFTFTDLQTDHTFEVSFEEKAKVGNIDSDTQLTRSLTEIDAYLDEHPTETLESYVLNQLNPKGSYTFEGETTPYEVPVTLTFKPGRVKQPLEAGTYDGFLTFDPTVWSGEAVTQPIQLIVTERTLSSVEPTPPAEPEDPTGPTDPSLPVDPTTALAAKEGPSEGNTGMKKLPQTGEQPSYHGIIGLLLVGGTGLLFGYKKKKAVITHK